MTKQNWNDEQMKLMEQYKKDYVRLFDELPPLEDMTLSHSRQKPLIELRKQFMKDMENASDK